MKMYLVVFWEKNRIITAYDLIDEDRIPQVKATMNISENDLLENNGFYISYKLSNNILSKYFDDIEENNEKNLIFHIYDGSNTIHDIICALENKNIDDNIILR